MRYGRDFDRDQWGRGRQGGMGRGFGGSWDEGRGEAGGMGADGYGGFGSDEIDNGYGGYGARGGRSGFGPGGGAYDNEFGSGRSYGGYGGGRGFGGGRPSSFGDHGGLYGGQGGGRERFGGSGGWEGGYGGGQGQERFSGGYGQTQGREGAGRGREQDETRRLRASEIMTENPETVTAEATLADAARKMRDLNVGIIPVVENDQSRRLRGVITDRDIAIRAVAEGRDASTTRVMEVMTTDIETCNKNDTVADILMVMQREQVRRVPITDREGRLVGIVAQADVARDIDSHQGEHRVADTLERISEPTRGGQMRAGSRNLGGQAGTSRAGSLGGRETPGETRTTQQRGVEE
jgi:CBS domain-containing protein